MLTGFAINTASQYLHNNCQIILEKVIALLTLSASDCIGMENSPLFEGYRLFKLFFSSVLLFLGILPLAYIRKNLIIDNELYGLFFGNYVYLAHYKLLKTKDGQKSLASAKLSPNLLRLSVGTEEPDLIIDTLKDALRAT